MILPKLSLKINGNLINVYYDNQHEVSFPLASGNDNPFCCWQYRRKYAAFIKQNKAIIEAARNN
jgi:hypothetical protein